jgi:hypothetical protein
MAPASPSDAFCAEMLLTRGKSAAGEESGDSGGGELGAVTTVSVM